MLMPKPTLLVFASGTKDGGGSGFKRLVLASRTDPPELAATIVGVVCNHLEGGVHQIALRGLHRERLLHRRDQSAGAHR